MEITFSGQIYKKEYLTIMMKYIYTRRRNLYWPVFGVFCLYMALYYKRTEGNEVLYLVLLGLGFYWVAIKHIYTYELLGNGFDTNKSSQSITQYVITEEKLYSQNQYSEGTVNWDALYFAINRPDAIILYVSNTSSFIILKRWLTPQQLQEFVAFLHTKHSIRKSGF